MTPTPPLGSCEPLAPPLFTSSVYRLPDLDALEAVYAGQPGFIYARDGHPNAAQLSAELTRRAAGSWGVVTASGMGALSAGILACVSAGDRVVASDQLYGRTTKLLRTEFARFGVSTTFVDTNDLDAVAAAVPGAKLVVAETITNPLCRVTDIAAVADIAHRHGAKLLIDNTFATPVLCRPLVRGADLVMESLTKAIGGHSDVTLGFLAGTDAALGEVAVPAVSTWGMTANPFDCWTVVRGLPTLDLRVRAMCDTAAAVAAALADRPGVTRVIYPGRADHPDRALAERLLDGRFGHMLCFELAGGREAVNRFLRQAPAIPFCPSLGHATTTCSYPDLTSHRFEAEADKRRMGITAGLVRLSCGCEPSSVVVAELARGLA